MWDPQEQQEAIEHYLLSSKILIFLGCLQIGVALITAYLNVSSIFLDPISLVLIGAIMITLGYWMRSDDALK